MRFDILEDIATELPIRPGTARNRPATRQDTPPSITVSRRRLFPLSEFEKWVVGVIAPIQEAPRKDAILFSDNRGNRSGQPRKLTQEDSRH
ncbi:MAG: DNA-binding protein [Acidiferrobacterales bacterium]